MTEEKILTVKEWLSEAEENPNINTFLIKLGQSTLGWRRKMVILKRLLMSYGYVKE